MRKIVFVTGSMGKGGAERVISILSRHYVEKKWKVYIAMLLHDKIEYNLSSRITIINLSSKYGIKKGFIKVINNLRKFVKKEKPDAIVCFMAQNILLTGIAVKKMKIPLIVSERIDPSQVKRNFIFKYFLNKIYENSSIVIFQTKRAQNSFNRVIRENSCIIGNPICVSHYKLDKTLHKIVTVGRMTEQKNHKMLINAFKKIHDKYPNYQLFIYGDGPLRNELIEIIKNLDLESCVFLPGVSNDIHKDISDSEMFVLSSNFEGLSNALMEAMLMGLPVISTNCAGSDEIIVNNQNGLLVPVGNELELINAIQRLIEDKDLCNFIGNNARKAMHSYEENNIINKWDMAINTAIKK